MQLSGMRKRLAWVATILLLQRTPIVQFGKKAVGLLGTIASKSWNWRVAIPVAGSQATWHAMSGATTYVTSTSGNAVTGITGDEFSFAFYTAGQHMAFSYDVQGLPSTLSYNGDVFGPKITGDLPEAGSYSIKITGYRNAGFSGNKTPTYELTLQVEPDLTASSPWNDSNTEPLGSGFWQSEWFGAFYRRGAGWTYHVNHGWLYLLGEDESGFWVFDQTLGWLYTGKDIHPFFYRSSTDSWLYDQSSSTTRKFWDYDASRVTSPPKN